MVRQCDHCGIKQSLYNFTCESCGTDLIDSGQLTDTLTFWGKGKSSSITQTLIPLGLITMSGIASAALGTHLILFVGIAVATIYYFKQNKSYVHR